jgi:hypothetical protein
VTLQLFFQDLTVSLKSIDNFAADATDILLRPALQVFPRLFSREVV